MKASVNAVTNGAKVRDTAGRLKSYAVKADEGKLDVRVLENIQYATSVTPATKLHEVVVVIKPEEGDMESRVQVKLLRFEILDVIKVEAVDDILGDATVTTKEAKATSDEASDKADLTERSEK